jgi:hypothetical protein
MVKTSWILLAVVIAVAAGGGAYYVIHRQTTEAPVQMAPVAPSPPVTRPQAPHEDLTKKKLEGIGSTRELKPVPIPQGPAK